MPLAEVQRRISLEVTRQLPPSGQRENCWRAIPKGLVFKRAGGYLGQHGHPVNFDGHFGRGLPERPWAYPIDPAHTQRIDLMMMVLGSLGTSPWFADNQVKDGYRNEDNKYEKN